mmetsp:Transcript_35286/g.112246  ORF Transcript_35286/g.112246 Transcript_35286/m.112246 type:complete len:364 (+) Transcript_35286:172-1263(+)
MPGEPDTPALGLAVQVPHPGGLLAETCDRCGKRLGFFFGLRGFGWRQHGHEHRCSRRAQQRLGQLEEAASPWKELPPAPQAAALAAGPWALFEACLRERGGGAASMQGEEDTVASMADSAMASDATGWTGRAVERGAPVREQPAPQSGESPAEPGATPGLAPQAPGPSPGLVAPGIWPGHPANAEAGALREAGRATAGVSPACRSEALVHPPQPVTCAAAAGAAREAVASPRAGAGVGAGAATAEEAAARGPASEEHAGVEDGPCVPWGGPLTPVADARINAPARPEPPAKPLAEASGAACAAAERRTPSPGHCCQASRPSSPAASQGPSDGEEPQEQAGRPSGHTQMREKMAERRRLLETRM